MAKSRTIRETQKEGERHTQRDGDREPEGQPYYKLQKTRVDKLRGPERGIHGICFRLDTQL